MALCWRAGSFWYWTASWMIHALALCAVDIPVAKAPPPEPAREPWATAGEPYVRTTFRDVAPGTAKLKARGYEDAISDLPLGGTGISGSLGAGGGGMAGCFGYGPAKPAKTDPRSPIHPPAEGAAGAALDWLLRHQRPNGHWEPLSLGTSSPEGATIPATALVLLAIMELGDTGQTQEFDGSIGRGLAWLVRQQHGNGAVLGFGAHRSAPAWEEYGHTLAALALVEGDRFLMDESLWEPARRALQFSLARHSSGLPGWQGGGSESVADHAGWHLALLRRARAAGHYFPDETFRKAGLTLAAMRRLEAASVGPCGRRSAWRGARVMEILAASSQPELDDRGLGMPPPAAPSWPACDLRAWRWSALTASLGDEAWRNWAGEARALMARKQLCGGPRDGSERDLDGSWETPAGETAAAGPYRGRILATALGALILADCRPREEL